MITHTNGDDLSALIYRKRLAETEVSYDIKYNYRISALQAWLHAKKIDMELNTLMSFEFEKDLENSDNDIARVRRVSQYLRVYARNCGVTPVHIWVRHRKSDSNIEQVGMLTHIPDGKFENFKSNCEGWAFEKISVTKVGSQKDMNVNGQKANIFEYLFRAVDNATIARVPNVVSELSGPIVGVRTFVSHKLRSYNN